MGSKVTISAPTIQKLLVFWNNGTNDLYKAHVMCTLGYESP